VPKARSLARLSPAKEVVLVVCDNSSKTTIQILKLGAKSAPSFFSTIGTHSHNNKSIKDVM